jgi:hypothetical protein
MRNCSEKYAVGRVSRAFPGARCVPYKVYAPIDDRELLSLLQNWFFVILNEVKDLNRLKIRDSSLHSE